MRIGCRKCGFLPRLSTSLHSKLLKFSSGGGSDINGVQGVGGSNPLVPTSLLNGLAAPRGGCFTRPNLKILTLCLVQFSGVWVNRDFPDHERSL